jgi:hypothetical protein
MLSVATSEGKKTDEGTMMARNEWEHNSVAVSGSAETQSLMPATRRDASDMGIKVLIYF